MTGRPKTLKAVSSVDDEGRALTVDAVEEAMIRAAVEFYPTWSLAAVALGISRSKMYRKMLEYGMRSLLGPQPENFIRDEVEVA